MDSAVCSDLSLLGPVTLRLYQKLKSQQLWKLFVELEMPLLPILAVMDNTPIQVRA
jgi:DNA polymerase I-like protein with 3'-5' exonuclease and polymerase domains